MMRSMASVASSLPTPPACGTSIFWVIPKTVSYQETLVSTSVTVMEMWCSAGWATADMASPFSWGSSGPGHCPDRIGEKDDKDAAGSYHEGAPSDPAGTRYTYCGGRGGVLRAPARARTGPRRFG